MSRYIPGAQPGQKYHFAPVLFCGCPATISQFQHFFHIHENGENCCYIGSVSATFIKTPLPPCRSFPRLLVGWGMGTPLPNLTPPGRRQFPASWRLETHPRYSLLKVGAYSVTEGIIVVFAQSQWHSGSLVCLVVSATLLSAS